MRLVSSKNYKATRFEHLVFDTAVQAETSIRVRAISAARLRAQLGRSETSHWSYAEAGEAGIVVAMSRSELNVMKILLDFKTVKPGKRYMRLEVSVSLLQGKRS